MSNKPFYVKIYIDKKGEIMKKNMKFLYAFVAFILLGCLFIAIGIYENRQKEEDYFYLNDIIENKNNEVDTLGYLEISQEPYSIAKYEYEDNHAFYIVFDGRYYYIAYLSDEVYETLNADNLKENTIKIYGTTAATPNEVREIAIDAYNEGLDEENQISLEEFESYFGEVYLNNVSLTISSYSYYYLSLIPITISFVFLIIFIVKTIKVKKGEKDTSKTK